MRPPRRPAPPVPRLVRWVAVPTAACGVGAALAYAGWLPREAGAEAFAGALAGAAYLASLWLTRPARAARSLSVPSSPQTTLDFVRRRAEQQAAADAPVFRVCYAAAAGFVLLALDLALDWHRRWPALDWLLPALLGGGGMIAIPVALAVGQWRAQRLNVHCPRCRALLLGAGAEAAYEAARRTRCCPRCGKEVLRPATAAAQRIAAADRPRGASRLTARRSRRTIEGGSPAGTEPAAELGR